MQNHLINLLFEECKLRSFVDRLCLIGVDVDTLNVKNHEVILDIIGFPKDNKHDYIKMMAAQGAVPFDTEVLPEGYYSREKLSDHFYDTVLYTNFNQVVTLTENGLIITKELAEKELRHAIVQHIDWLYSEYNNIGRKSVVI